MTKKTEMECMAVQNGDAAVTSLTLKNLTPTQFRCSFGGCPAVFEMDDNQIVIIGKKASEAITNQLKDKVSQDEWVVVIDRHLLSNVNIE
jgi:hypothetical protein